MITILQGDVRVVLPTLPTARFRTCVTSPPYWEQREYLSKEHPDKSLEIGHEPTPSLYVMTLVEVFRDVRRLLTDDGTLWVNIGDKYSNDLGGYVAGGTKSEQANRIAKRKASCGRLGKGRVDVPPKNLIGLPWRLAFALQNDGWILRSEIIWEKPNAQPSSVQDRPTTSHEHLFLLAKNESYFFNQDAIREPNAPIRKSGKRSMYGQRATRPRGNLQSIDEQSYNPLGRNCRSVWSICTGGSDGAHIAPMPRDLARRCILAGSAPTDHVLDPFGGSGTVGRVAEDEGRNSVMIDLDEAAIAMAHSNAAQAGLFASKG